MKYKQKCFHCADGEMLEHKPREVGALPSLEIFNTELDKVPSSRHFYVILQMTMELNRRNCTYEKSLV